MVMIKKQRQLRNALELVAKNNLRLLIINGSGGTGKTTIANEVLPTAMVIKGHLTPLKLYIDIYNIKPSYIIIDDVDELFKNKIMTSLLKQLCDSGIDKTLSYASTHSKLNGIPQLFDANFIQGIVIITNDDLEKTNVSTLRALKNRGLSVTYEPTIKETVKVASLFCKKQTLKYFTDFLIKSNSLRDYHKIDTLIKAGIDVYEQLDDFLSMLSPKQQLLVQLLLFNSKKQAEVKSGLSNHDFNTVLSVINAKRRDFADKVKREVF